MTVYRDALRTSQASGTSGGGAAGEVGLAEDEIGDAAAQWTGVLQHAVIVTVADQELPISAYSHPVRTTKAASACGAGSSRKVRLAEDPISDLVAGQRIDVEQHAVIVGVGDIEVARFVQGDSLRATEAASAR